MINDFYGTKRRFLKNMLKVLLFIVIAILAFLGCLIAATACASVYSAYRGATEWREKTTPLSKEVIQDLCSEFSLPPDHDLCRQDAGVYAPDFFPVIRDTFIPEISTYEDIQGKLGKYQSYLEPLTRQANGKEYFVSRYDLKGDDVTSIVFFFHGNGVLERIAFVTGSSN
jgi:hypothetical protein